MGLGSQIWQDKVGMGWFQACAELLCQGQTNMPEVDK